MARWLAGTKRGGLTAHTCSQQCPPCSGTGDGEETCRITAQREAVLLADRQEHASPSAPFKLHPYMSSIILLKVPLMWNKIYLQSKELLLKQYHG